MLPPVFCSAYLPSVSCISRIAAFDRVCIEQYDNYRKQTFRNRCIIATSSGRQALTIPVVKSDTPKQLMRDVRISDHGNWRHLHWAAMESAYMNSPFFMYYEDDLRPLYCKQHSFLIDFNQELLCTVLRLMGVATVPVLSESFASSSGNDCQCDYRWMIECDTIPISEMPPYYQVFRQRNGFLPDLSIVDLLFNLGPESALYLNRLNALADSDSQKL